MFLKSRLPIEMPTTDAPARKFTPDLHGLIAWLETQDASTAYDPLSSKDCLICRFASAIAGKPLHFIHACDTVKADYRAISHTAHLGMPTYAAALTRARALARGGHNV